MYTKSDIVKRVLAGISLFIVAVVVIATIVMANIDVKYNINCATPNSILIRTSKEYYDRQGGDGYMSSDPDSAQSAKIVDLINNASKRSVLTNLFERNVKKQATISQVSTASSSTRTLTTPSGLNYEYFVIYRYREPQLLKLGKNNYLNADGEVYYYRDLCFGVKTTDGEAEVNVYVVPYYTTGSNPTNNYESKYHYYYNLNADWGDLISYLQQNWVA